MRRSSPDQVGQVGRIGRVLLAYFSRPGENYHYGRRTDLKVGDTEAPVR
jgi:hypothetical protein